MYHVQYSISVRTALVVGRDQEDQHEQAAGGGGLLAHGGSVAPSHATACSVYTTRPSFYLRDHFLIKKRLSVTVSQYVVCARYFEVHIYISSNVSRARSMYTVRAAAVASVAAQTEACPALADKPRTGARLPQQNRCSPNSAARS